MRNTHNKSIGKIGEDIACAFLSSKGFTILGRNYLRKTGEIDIVSIKDGVHAFFEVKTVTQETNNDFSRETIYRPEDKIDSLKLKKMKRTGELYVLENRVEGEWEVGMVAVTLDESSKRATCRIMENIV
jgi:putative endonuclease